jgi:hypothetical protein
VAAVIAIVAGLLAPPAFAAEGANQYPHGVNTWLAGALPPPGIYFINMFGRVDGTLKDGSGDQVRLPDGSEPSVGVWFEAMRMTYVSDKKILGGTWAAQIIVPLVRQEVDLGGPGSAAGLGDLTFGPFYLAWHGEQVHAIAGMDIYVPNGVYDASDARRSIGADYMSYTPLVSVSWLPPSGWEASSLVMFNITAENRANDYKSGNTFHADYLVGKHLGQWGVGVSGYVVKQVTDDEQDGRVVDAVPGVWGVGRRGQVLAAGPSVTYTAGKNIIVLQWNHEMAVRNRFGGDRFLFKAILPF